MALVQANEQTQLYPTIAGSYLRSAFTFAAISSTTIVANAPPGLYRFSVYLVVTTAQSSQTVTVNAIWADDQQTNTVAVLSAVSTTSQGYFQGSTVMENTATANLNFSMSAAATTAVGNFYILIERLF